MGGSDVVCLSRSVKALLLPSHTDVLLASGSSVRVLGMRGGKCALRGIFGTVLIDPADASGLGLEDFSKKLCRAEVQAGGAGASQEDVISQKPSLEDLWEVAKTVYDPEIPVNIVDLGLVYCMDLIEENGVNKVKVDMTLTAPGCAMGPAIAADLKYKLEALPSVGEAVVNIVWEPPWNQDMMTQNARMILGLE